MSTKSREAERIIALALHGLSWKKIGLSLNPVRSEGTVWNIFQTLATTEEHKAREDAIREHGTAAQVSQILSHLDKRADEPVDMPLRGKCFKDSPRAKADMGSYGKPWKPDSRTVGGVGRW